MSTTENELGERDRLLSDIKNKLGERDQLLSDLKSELREKAQPISDLKNQFDEKTEEAIQKEAIIALQAKELENLWSQQNREGQRASSTQRRSQ